MTKKSQRDEAFDQAVSRIPRIRTGTDSVRIGECNSIPESSRALARRAWMLARALDGDSLNGELERLDKEDRHLIRRILRSKPENRQDTYDRCLEGLGQEEKKRLVKAVSAVDLEAADPDEVGTMSQAAERVKGVKWFWFAWIPFGFVTLIAGAPGIGKTTFVIYALIRAVVLAFALPDGSRGPKRPGKVLLIDTESRQAINIDHMRQWGIPLNQVITPYPNPLETVLLDDPQELDNIREVIRVHKPDLVVVDSLRAAHRQDENSSKVGNVLDRLGEIARDTNAAVVVVHHCKKGDPERPLTMDDVRGSNSQVASAVSVIGIEAPDAGNDWRKVSILKSNVSAQPTPIGFKHVGGKPEFGPLPEPAKRKTELTRAEAFLRRELAAGERPASELEELAYKREHFSEATIKRAKRKLHVTSKKQGKRWFCSLPGNEGAQEGTGGK